MVLLWTFFSLCLHFTPLLSLSVCCHSQRTKRTLEQTTTANLVEYYILFCLVLPVAAAAAVVTALAFAHSTHTNSLTCIQTIRIILVWILFIFFAHTRAHTHSVNSSALFHYSFTLILILILTRTHVLIVIAVFHYVVCTISCAHMLVHLFARVCVCAFDIFRLFLLDSFISHPFSVFVWMCACVRVFVWKKITYPKQRYIQEDNNNSNKNHGHTNGNVVWFKGNQVNITSERAKNKNYHLKRVFNSVCVVDIRFLLLLFMSLFLRFLISSHLLFFAFPLGCSRCFFVHLTILFHSLRQ